MVRWRGAGRGWDKGVGKLALRANDLNGGKPGWTYDCALSPDGTRLATAHGDGTVKVWAVKDLLGK